MEARGVGARTAMAGAVTVIATFVAGKAARDAILLSNFDVTLLPLFVGISAAVSLPLVLTIGRLIGRWGPERVMPALNAVSATLLLVEWMLLESYPQVGAAATFFHLSALGAVLVSGFWSIINERFDARTARTQISRLGVAATIGGVVGGLIAERVAAYLVPSSILIVLAGLQLTCAAIQRRLGAGRPWSPRAVQQTSHGALNVVAKTPLLRNLAFVVVLGAIAAAAIDYVFKFEVVAATGPSGPLRFFAFYYTATNVMTAAAQILLGRRAITKVGVPGSVATLPATVTLFGVGALVVPGLASIAIARGAELVTRSSIFRAAYELTFAPLAEHQKRSTKVLLDVGADRIGDLLGAQLVGLCIYAAAPNAVLLIVGLVAALAGLAFALLLPRSYMKALEQSLLVRGRQEADVNAWSTVGPPTLADAGDLTALSLLDFRLSPVSTASPEPVPRPVPSHDDVVDRLVDRRGRVTRSSKR